MPVAIHDPGGADAGRRYLSGRGHAPEAVLAWETPEALFAALRRTDEETLAPLAAASRRWYARRLTFPRFARRLAAILAVTEGRGRAPLDPGRAAAVFDAGFYRAQYPDVAGAGQDPLAHYLAYGAPEGRRPHRLFDPGYYLSQLSDTERPRAGAAPLAHYLLRGEAAGLRPHPLFDPAHCARALDAAGAPAAPTVLERYLAAPRPVAPHLFFDPAHYARQVPLLPGGVPLLMHFLAEGAAGGLDPHPLVGLDRLAGPGGDRAAAFLAWLMRDAPDAEEPSPHPLFDPQTFCRDDAAPLAALAPNLLWVHLIEGDRAARRPHPLISASYIRRTRPETFVTAAAALTEVATGRFEADTHPLVSGAHIRAQVPGFTNARCHPTAYFIRFGAAHNIDPHPWFSTQYYLYNNPDVREAGVNPLLHFLTAGEAEGRRPHPFFDGKQYHRQFLKAAGGGDGPLLDYATRGAALFRPALRTGPALAALTRRTALHFFETGTAAGGDGASGAALLAAAQHPEEASPHPTLVTETRPCETGADPAAEQLAPARARTVARPAVIAQTHIAPPAGRHEAPAATAMLHRDALVVAGNDGFADQDGAWHDPGLAGFDPGYMRLRNGGAVAGLSGGRVLLRRYDSGAELPAGIFASGTYSHNYFHFLIEILPRVLLAVEIAPAGTPVLADDGMPAQHYQALRLLLPGHPIRRLSRQSSYRVGRLYAASMPNVVHDAFGCAMPPAEALCYHPEITRRLAALADPFRGPGKPARRIYLKRESRRRRILNLPEIEEILEARGFETVPCDRLDFAEQIRQIANAGTIVAQSGAQLANMVFAAPGTRIFPLFSNAPGTNFHLWSALGEILGQDVTNIAGWRVRGTAPAHVPEAHEDFTLWAGLLAPFLGPAGDPEVPADDPHPALDALYDAVAEADTLTGAGALLSRPTPDWVEPRLARLRARARAAIEAAPAAALEGILAHRLYGDPGGRIRSGLAGLGAAALEPAEEAALEALGNRFADWATAGAEAVEEEDPDGLAPLPPMPAAAPPAPGELRRALAVAMLYLPAWRLPLLPGLEAMPPDLAARYLGWLAAPPLLIRAGEDRHYVGYAARLLDWLDGELAKPLGPALHTRLAETAAGLDLGQLLLIDAPVTKVMAARGRLLAHVALADGAPRAAPRPADGSQGRVRIGVICRTFDKGPDAEAVVAVFRAFDQSRFEIFAYSVGFEDRVVSRDSAFARLFDAAIDHRRMLPPEPAGIRAQLLADDLDVLLFANATTYGLGPLDRALFHRVAPLQLVLNSHMPLPMGYPSFDGYLTAPSDDPAAEVDQADCPERLIRVPGPATGYLTSFTPREKPPVDRALLGLAEDDVVLMNAGAFSKLRHACLTTMMRAAKAVPKGVLMLAPYNPGWAGQRLAFAFNRQLAEAAEETGLSMDRIRVLGELSVAETEGALALSDIYLNPFPHGGATMTHLALIYGKPPVTLRRRSTRSIDQFLVASLGFPELLASTPEDYVARAAELGGDGARRRDLSARIAEAARAPVFVDNPGYSRDIQAAIEAALAERPVREIRPVRATEGDSP